MSRRNTEQELIPFATQHVAIENMGIRSVHAMHDKRSAHQIFPAKPIIAYIDCVPEIAVVRFVSRNTKFGRKKRKKSDFFITVLHVARNIPWSCSAGAATVILAEQSHRTSAHSGKHCLTVSDFWLLDDSGNCDHTHMRLTCSKLTQRTATTVNTLHASQIGPYRV